MRIRKGVTAWLGNVANRPHDRYRSWEHCYHYFQRNKRDGIASDPDHAALHLGFYLASWGMYRGSAFLLQHAYTVHLGVVDVLTSPKFTPLWETEFGSEVNGLALVPLILEATNEIRGAYAEF